MKAIFFGVLFVLLLVSVFTGTFNIQSAKVNVSSRGETVQATGTDWWPMFHHDLSHTGTSTSTAPNTNQTLWISLVWINWVFSSSAVVGGLVYVGSEDNNVHCLNAITGALVWNYTTGSYVISSPAVAGGKVYVGSLDSKVYCLDASTGAYIWNYTTGGAVWSSPAVVDGRVYVGSDDHKVYCLDASTGAYIWDYATGSNVGYSSPAVVSGLVYVGSLDRNVYCLNAATGALVWSYTTDASVYSSPAVVDGLVYVGSLDKNVYCLNATTGVFVWNYTTGGEVWSSPAVAGGLVYVGSYDNNVYCLNAATGALVWSYTTGGDVESSPAVAGGLVYVGSRDDFFYCLNAATGAFVWSYKTDYWVESSPAVVDGIVYVGSGDGRVYAFGLYVSISPSSVVMDVGQFRLFTSNVSGGTSPYSYQWYLNDAPVSGATSTQWTFTPASPGSYTIYLNITDAISAIATSNTATATVNAAPSASISPSSPTLDVGQSQLFTSTVSDGTPPYTYQWYLNNVAVSGATSSTWTFTANSSGSYNVYVNVTDSVSFIAKSNIASVTVNPPPSVTISPSSVVMDVGQSRLFTSSVTGGTSPYTYQWYLNDAPVSSVTSSSWTFTPSSSGSYTVYVNVTDNVGAIAKSNTATVTVNLAPSVTISPTSVTMDVGQAKLFTSSVSGGTSPYSYQWYLDGAPVSGASSVQWTFTPSSSGSYSVYVIVTDHVGVSDTSPVSNVAVNPQLAVTISTNSTTIYLGESQNFTSIVSGGTSPYTYQWYVNGAPVPGATSNTWTFTPNSSDSYTLYLFVTDSAGEIAISPAFNIIVLIPEFQPLFFLSLFMMATLLAAFALKRKRNVRT